MGVAARLCIAAALVTAPGCSFLFVRVPDKPPAPARCPAGAIGADVIGTAFWGAGTAGAAYSLSQGEIGAGVGVVTVPLLLVYGLSLWYGVSERSDCHDLQRQQEQERVADEAKAAKAHALRTPMREDVVGDAPIYC